MLLHPIVRFWCHSVTFEFRSMLLTKYLKSLLVQLQPFVATLSLPGFIHTVPKNPSTSVRSRGMRDLHTEKCYLCSSFISSRSSLKQNCWGLGVIPSFCSSFARLVVHTIAQRDLPAIHLKFLNNFKSPWKRKHLLFVRRVWYHLQFSTRPLRSSILQITRFVAL